MLGFTGRDEHHVPDETQRFVADLVELDPFNPTYAAWSSRLIRSTIRQLVEFSHPKLALYTPLASNISPGRKRAGQAWV
jgi:hypothetical protein